MSAKLPAEDRFWSKVDQSGECWEWMASRNSRGYGHLGINGRMIRAHRFSYHLTNGEIPEGMQVDHICRNKGCVRPTHLRLATPAQNSEHQDGHAGSRSGLRGVSFHRQSGKWQAKATKAGKTHFGGLFTNPDEAAEAARLLRLNLFSRNELDKVATK